MSQVFHDIEKKIRETLQKTPNQTPEQLSKNTELSIDQIRRGIEWLRLKDLAIVKNHLTFLRQKVKEQVHHDLEEKLLG